MKIVAKCSAFVSLSYQVQVKVCNPIPLSDLKGCFYGELMRIIPQLSQNFMRQRLKKMNLVQNNVKSVEEMKQQS